jgi:hypothetical protein
VAVRRNERDTEESRDALRRFWCRGGAGRHCWRLLVAGVGALAISIGPLAGAASAATDPGTPLFAYPAGTAGSSSGCVASTAAASECSLSAALSLAESTAGSVTVELAAGTYAMSANLTIDDSENGSLTLAGPSGTPAEAVLSGAGIAVGGTTPVVLEDLEVTGAGSGAVTAAEGSTVTITGSTITQNTNGSTNKGSAGGISNSGTMTVTGSVVSDNQESSSGGNPMSGGIYNSGTMKVTGSVVSDNSLPNSFWGGGITNGGEMIIESSTVADNTAGNDESTASSHVAFGSGGGIS